MRVDGLLQADDIRLFGGRLSGTGRLRGNVESRADIEPGNSVGTLTVDGNLRALGDVNLELASATEYDTGSTPWGPVRPMKLTMTSYASRLPSCTAEISASSEGGKLNETCARKRMSRGPSALSAAEGALRIDCLRRRTP